MSQALREQQLQNCAEWNMQMRDRHMRKANEAGMGESPDLLEVKSHMRDVHHFQRNVDNLNAQLRRL